MKAVILAGGYANRLRSVTENGRLAKPLLPITIDGKTQPILYFILDKINDVHEYFDEVIVISNEKYLAQFEQAALDYGSKCKLTILSDGSTGPENARGANGSLRMANYYIPQDYQGEVLVLAGDNYFDFELSDLLNFYERKSLLYKENCNVLVSKVYPESEKAAIADRFGILEFDKNKRVKALQEKPGIEKISSTNVCLAVYLFNRPDFNLIETYLTTQQDAKKRDNLGHFIDYVSKNSSTYSFEFDGKFIDIGTPDDYYSLAPKTLKN